MRLPSSLPRRSIQLSPLKCAHRLASSLPRRLPCSSCLRANISGLKLSSPSRMLPVPPNGAFRQFKEINCTTEHYIRLKAYYSMDPVCCCNSSMYTPLHTTEKSITNVRVEVFSAESMKNGVFWVVTPCGSCKNRRLGGTWHLLQLATDVRCEEIPILGISSQRTSVLT
jgi:hypothetical protein